MTMVEIRFHIAGESKVTSTVGVIYMRFPDTVHDVLSAFKKGLLIRLAQSLPICPAAHPKPSAGLDSPPRFEQRPTRLHYMNRQYGYPGQVEQLTRQSWRHSSISHAPPNQGLPHGPGYESPARRSWQARASSCTAASPRSP